MAPGLAGWAESRAVLRGERAYEPAAPLPRLLPGSLPANERRRSTQLIRLALAVTDEAINASGVAPDRLRSVFASANGDIDVVDRICETLVRAPEEVSPTLFHNSVHNAPSGYWCIGAHSTGASTSLSAFDASFGAGLLEAWTQLLAEPGPVLLVAYDAPTDTPLGEYCPVPAAFACALALTQTDASPRLGCLSLSRLDTPAIELIDPGLERLRQGNPSAGALPLLQALAVGGRHVIGLPMLRGPGVTLRIES